MHGRRRGWLIGPTSHYAYHPSDNAVLSVHEFAGRNWHLQDRKRIMMSEITEGIDELGVLLAGHAKNAYWYGSQLSIAEARELAPYNSATSLQVTAAALAGMIWAMENPQRGIVEPDDMDYRRPLEICRPYLGPVVGKYTDWTPLYQRGELFAEDLDTIGSVAVQEHSGGLSEPTAVASAPGVRRRIAKLMATTVRVAAPPGNSTLISSSRRLPKRLCPRGESMLM